MSAFAVIFERTNSPLDPAILGRAMERLTHRGPDGWDKFISDRLSMGHWHFWTTPEEVDEKQPLRLADLPFRIVLDGRLDNRSDLIPRLGLPASISDAALILRAYARWGADCFAQFVGEYALVIHDETRDQLICARDALGDRTLFYSMQGSLVTIASEPWAATSAHPSVTLSEEGLTSYFSFQAASNGQTLFQNVYELLPAQVMVITSSGDQTHYSWNPDHERRARFNRDEEYAEQFLALLEQSVRSRMRATTPVGISMSGGLDSTSIACLAVRMLAPQPLKTISFVFNEEHLKECDEQVYINAVRDQWHTDSIQIPSDDAWSYKDWQHALQTANRPDGNVFRMIKERVYRRAHEEGLRVLFTGEGGDHLYAAGRDWLSDLLLKGRILDSARSLQLQIQRKGWRNVRIAGHIPRALRTIAKSILPAWLTQRLRAKPAPPAWLTAKAASLWRPETNRFHPSFERHENILGLLPATSVTAEIPLANRHAIELRHPYRDRRLAEYVLSLPAYQLYYGGLYKHILRVAMKGPLPEIIRTRPRPTALLALYKLGMEKEGAGLLAALNSPDALWPEYVRSDWLRANWEINKPADQVGTESIIGWLCVSFESWYKCTDMAIVD